MIDEPLLSLGRILAGIRQWFWLVIVNELDLKANLWYFIVYHRRPYASHRAGKY